MTNPIGQDDAKSWQTLKTVVYVAGIAFAVFMAGVNFGAARDTATKLEAHEARSEATYVRKDGAELAALRERVDVLTSQVRAANDKLDYLIRQGR